MSDSEDSWGRASVWSTGTWHSMFADHRGIEKDENESDTIGLQYKYDLRDRVSTDLMKMLREGSFNDVCIKLHDGEIKANKSVLAARCEYFAATFRWKGNNNQDVEEIVVTDCSKKIMTCIIEYLFSGILKANGLNLLEFWELNHQVRKMFPGDELKEEMERILNDGGFIIYKHLRKLPTHEEVAKAISLVETGNLQPEVLVDLARAIETLIINGNSGFEEQVLALANLVSYGVIETIQHLRLEKDLGFLSVDQLRSLVSCVTERMDFSDVSTSTCDMETLLDLVKCKELHIPKRMNQDETEALVRAMASRIEILHLEAESECLDIDTFSKNKGDGTCREVHIYCKQSVNNNDLTFLFDSVNCKELHLYTQEKRRLDEQETEALVRAMTSGVEILYLGSFSGENDKYISEIVNLDFDTLTKYSGDGTCREVHCNQLRWIWNDAFGRSHPKAMDDEAAKTWAENMNWDWKEKIYCEYLLSRKKTV